MSTTSDRDDPLIHQAKANGQNETYLVLSDEELAKEFVRPFRDSYIHNKCGTLTTMGFKIAASYARDNTFYTDTFCCRCGNHYPIREFTWDGSTERVGS